MSGLTFKSKAQREAEQLQEQEARHKEAEERRRREEEDRRLFLERERTEAKRSRERAAEEAAAERVEGIGETRAEVELMKKAKAVGMEVEKRVIIKPEKLALEGFKHDLKDDTTRLDANPIYLQRVAIPKTVPDGFAPRKKKKSAAEAAQTAQQPRTHWSEKNRSEMTARDWRIFREDHLMSSRGGRIPHPARNWQETGLPANLLEAVAKVGYTKPSPIQMQAIPCALMGRDIIGIAETGSGKTAAFTLPMLVYISRQAFNPEQGPLALILAPVRELVLQIAEEVRKLGGSSIKCVSIVGGELIEAQGSALREGAHVVVATPGRLKDCLERRYAVLNQCNYLVLDEADRMVDMGFEDDLKFILSQMKMEAKEDFDDDEDEFDEIEADFNAAPTSGRTTILYSATMPPSVERIARSYLNHPINVTIGSAGKAVDRIEQRVIWISPNARNQRVLQDLKSVSPPAIVFCNQKKDCDALAKFLSTANISCTVLHSGKSQEQREQNLLSFKSGRYDVLIATNVAGRGIDVKGVMLVVNFDCPPNIDDYCHRIGRTGRAGALGTAVTYISEADSAIFYDLKKFLDSSKKAYIPAELRSHPQTRIKPGGLTDKHGKSVRGVE